MQISATTNTVNLDNGVANLGTGAIKVTMLEGGAWVTNGNEDVAIKCGQSLELPSSKYAKILSPLEYDFPVSFKVQQIENVASSQQKSVKYPRFATLLKAMIR